MTKQIANYPARILLPENPQEIVSTLELDLEDGVTPFLWEAEISSTRLDAYYTHMDKSSLQNFAADAQAGVSFLDSHDSYKLGFGQSFAGRIDLTDGVIRTVAGFYTIPGIKFGGIHSYESTDDFIRAVKGRLARDVSVGFYDGTFVCDICGEDVWGFRTSCPHFPGVEYPIGEQGNETVTATATICDAHLAETSAVYNGATPEAMILKARAMAEAGNLEAKAVEVLQFRYRINLPDKYQSWQGVDLKSRDRSQAMPKTMEELQAEIMEAAGKNAVKLEDGVRWLINDRQRLEDENDKLTNRVTELTPLADDGRAYRQDLISETIAEGVRAMGEDFNQETYQLMLEGAGLDHIKMVRDGFVEIAKRRFPNGRQTTETDETEQSDKSERVNTSAPDEAYI